MRYGIGSILIAGIVLCGSPATAAPDDTREAERHALWDRVESQIARMGDEIGFSRLSPAVREALRNIPRHRFVPEDERRHAYQNRPLPIGFGQTISQPLMVAIMTELLAVETGDRVFELGTGSAYQAAILDALGAEVYSVEIIPELGQQARLTLDQTGHERVVTRVSDGYFGWPEQAPFDAIIVTAASDHIPPPLIRQLKAGGRMLIPVGSRYTTQTLVLVSRDEQGAVQTRELMPVSFVPLTGQH